MVRYAQIDADGFIVGISDLSTEMEQSNLILVSEDFDYKNKRYVDGNWQYYEPEPVEEAIETQQLQEEMALNMEYLVALKEMELEF